MRWFDQGWRTAALLTALVLICSPAFAQRARRAAPQQATPKAASSSAQLRAEWDMGDLKITREAVDDGNFPPDIKEAAIQAVDWFTGQQESLISGVDKDPKTAAAARKKRPQIEQEFNRRMQVITGNAQFQAELTNRVKALNKEMDDMASSADKIFAHLDSVGLSKEQKASLQPVVKDASSKLKAVAEKSPRKTLKDKEVRDDAAKTLQAAHAKIKRTLTKEQRDKLAKKLAAENDQ